MRTSLLLVLLLVTTFKLNAQAISEKDIIGNWSVVKMHEMSNEIPAEAKEQLIVMQKAFLKSKFYFKADKNFSFEFPFEEMKIKNGHWKLINQTGDINIQEWKDKDKEKPLLMGIKVFKKDGKMIFMIEETFFAFEVKKDS